MSSPARTWSRARRWLARAPNGAPGRGSDSTLFPLLLAVLALASAVAVVQLKQHARDLTTRLDELRREHRQLELESAQLQLEQATLAQHGRVDALARKQFGMVDPLDYRIVQDAPPAAAGASARSGAPR
jgi:cell division protein FtsL